MVYGSSSVSFVSGCAGLGWASARKAPRLTSRCSDRLGEWPRQARACLIRPCVIEMCQVNDRPFRSTAFLPTKTTIHVTLLVTYALISCLLFRLLDTFVESLPLNEMALSAIN
jgi:hypothetical protein